MLERQRLIQFTYRVVSLARSEQLTVLSAAVAFYAFVSLVPLALLALGIATTVGGQPLVEQVMEVTAGVLTPAAQEVLAETLVDDVGRQGATVVGALGLLWGASRVLYGLDQVFSAVYGTVASKSVLDIVWDSTVVLLAILIGFGSVAIFELVVQYVPGIELGPLTPVFSLAALFLAFFPMYFVFPDVSVSVRDALPGTAIAAVGWFVLGHVFGFYGAIAGELSVYGALGVVLLVLVWLYVGAAILIAGAIVNAVLAGVDVNRQLQSPGARQVSTEAMSDDVTGTDEPEETDRPGSSASGRTRDRGDDPAALREEIRQLEDRLEAFEESVDDRTVKRQSLEAELKRYVRRRARRSHARGWGPYLVLLYGTAMTVAAFYFLEGLWAVLAMFVVWTSTLGVYLLMVLFGTGLSLLGVPGRLRDRVSEWRS